ncbi:uncharacterized protein LOC111912690 isoform X1 [Lactuca sativa]|uniref:uncharacterized protein LOC111912690 isoform X1 n=1 Tax=Lactuca sativa TaxID=4236 RepID=UPI000CD84ED9|nr:uncharacterized protein LOC111912690 isoform X1 [Lactuca sativa]
MLSLRFESHLRIALDYNKVFGHHQVQFHPSNSNVWEFRMDNQNSLTMIAGGMVYNSVICLLWFPGGLANIGKTAGDWVFLHADLVALFISMAVLVAGMTVGPTFWKKMEKLARKLSHGYCNCCYGYSCSPRYSYGGRKRLLVEAFC